MRNHMMTLKRWAGLCLAILLVGGIFCDVLGAEKNVTARPDSALPYEEDFETGALGWKLENGWKVEKADGTMVLRGMDHKWAWLENKSWSNYSLNVKFKKIKGSIHFNYRHNFGQDGLSRYFIGVAAHGQIYLMKQEGQEFTELTQQPLVLGERWHELDIRGYEDAIYVYLDGALQLSYKDLMPLYSGGIAFETLDDSEFLIDEIDVQGISSAF